MRAPDAALIRARAKAPLRDLQALHLSGAGVECVRHLELCRDALRSLYADANRLRDLEGLLVLRRLWRVDLNDNALHRGLYKNQKSQPTSLLAPLASFAALGFLYLERNQLHFDDLVCLRDVHIMELRLQGNPALLQESGSNGVVEYRRKIVALLPNVWILDGHYVTSAERERAIDEHDAFVQYLLTYGRDNGTGGVCGKFGSTAELWGGVVSESDSGGRLHEQNENATKLIEHIHTQRVYSAELTDRHRLHTIVALHNEECAVHNRHCKFAPSKFSPNARAMSTIPLQELLALPRQIRLEVAVTLAAYLEFGFAKALLIEAVTIQLLGCEDLPADAAEELASLPPNALTAILCIMRHHSLEEITQRTDSELELERMLWTSMPPLFTTLLGFDKDARHSPERTEQSFAMRCHFVVGLLSRAASFPDDMLEYRSDRRSGKDASGSKCLAELLSLVQISKMMSNNSSSRIDDNGNEDYTARSGGIPPVFIMGPWISGSGGAAAVQEEKKTSRLPWKSKLPSRDYPRPWDKTSLSTSLSTSALDSEYSGVLDTSKQQPSVKRRPRAGEWLEIRPKQFLKIRQLSEDGSHVIAFQSTESSSPLIIHVDQLSRVSSNMWRVAGSEIRQQAEKNLRSSSLGSGKLGKLHRGSEGFHRHGAARSQGFPNHTVTNEDLQELERIQTDNEQSQSAPAEQIVQPVALFCSNDTIDSNFVLAPPQLVSAQNYCAIKNFRELGLSPVGLWSPIKQTPFAMLPAATSRSHSIQRTTSNGNLLADVKAPKYHESSSSSELLVQPDLVDTKNEWAVLQREMESVLRIKSRQSAADFVAPKTSQDVLCFITAVPSSEVEGQDESPSDASGLAATSRSTAPEFAAASPQPKSKQLSTSLGSQRSTSWAIQQSKTRISLSPSWHQVSTKPQLIVSSGSVPSLGRRSSSHVPPSSPSLATPPTNQDPAVSTASTRTPRTHSASRAPPKPQHYTVVLPTISQK